MSDDLTEALRSAGFDTSNLVSHPEVETLVDELLPRLREAWSLLNAKTGTSDEEILQREVQRRMGNLISAMRAFRS